jgi:hypothetical protein
MFGEFSTFIIMSQNLEALKQEFYPRFWYCHLLSFWRFRLRCDVMIDA